MLDRPQPAKSKRRWVEVVVSGSLIVALEVVGARVTGRCGGVG